MMQPKRKHGSLKNTSPEKQLSKIASVVPPGHRTSGTFGTYVVLPAIEGLKINTRFIFKFQLLF